MLADDSGQTCNCLCWESVSDTEYGFSHGLCVSGSDTATLLEDTLAQLALTRRAANVFIVYWLPRMEQSPYNLIAFQSNAYAGDAVLTITPEPDSVLRVFMAWKSPESPAELPPQDLPVFRRTGFTMVEWGDTKVG